MNSTVLILPFASIYQVVEHKKLEKLYKDSLELAKKTAGFAPEARINQKCSIAEGPTCKRLYDARWHADEEEETSPENSNQRGFVYNHNVTIQVKKKLGNID